MQPLPDFHQIAVRKRDITKPAVFKELVQLYDLEIVYDEPEYYILDGSLQDIHDFQKYWRDV